MRATIALLGLLAVLATAPHAYAQGLGDGIEPGTEADGVRTYSGRIGADQLVRTLRAKERDAKNRDAQFDLCSFYGEKMDYAESLKWCQVSADRGDSEAQVKMGDIYSQRLGVPADKKEAFNWYLLAAEGGNEAAQLSVASAYANGEGIAQNDAEAWFWQSVTAGENEGEASRQHREELSKNLAPQTRATLEQRLAGWKQKQKK